MTRRKLQFKNGSLFREPCSRKHVYQRSTSNISPFWVTNAAIVLCQLDPGLTWLLSNEIVEMHDERWQSYFENAQLISSQDAMTSQMEEFLFYQRALNKIGLLALDRKRALTSAGFSLEHPEQTEEDRQWDQNISELLRLKSQESEKVKSFRSLQPNAGCVTD